MESFKPAKGEEAKIKGVGHKLGEEDETNNNKDMSNELANLNKISEKDQMPVIKIQAKDITLLQNELDYTFEEAKLSLIRYQGDVKKAIDAFLNDFNLEDN